MASASGAGTKKVRTGPAPTLENSPLKWREDEFNALATNFYFEEDWSIEFPSKESTAATAPEGKIALYADFLLL